MPVNEYALPINPDGPPTYADSQLVITAWGLLIFQGRRLTQTLEIIQDASKMVRNSNGQLIDLSNPAFRKYLSKITCTDVRAPPFDALWPGMQVSVQCANFLCYPNGNPDSPGRPEVSGSSWTANGFTFYRPELTMMVKSVSWQREEWVANLGWSFELEEV